MKIALCSSPIPFKWLAAVCGLVLANATLTQAATRPPVRARTAMVASTDGIASRVGSQVLQQGGNAVDAAVAVGLALAVTYPPAGNLGGGGFMMVRLKDGTTTAIDYRETAPQAAGRNVYLDAKGEPIEGQGGSTFGYRAPGVPGTVAGLALAWRKYGSHRLSWAQLAEPARRLALDGFPLSYRLARSFRENRTRLGTFSESRRIFLKDGALWNEGDTFKQPELAATLARLQKGGPDEFYKGETARLIAADMAKNNGLITLADLAAYRPRERVPLKGTYRGYQIVAMPPPSSGGVLLIEMLNMLEGTDLSAYDAFSARRYHLLTEIMRRAFADRAEYPGDPDFVKVPVAQLTDKAYARRRSATIDANHVTASTAVGPGLEAPHESLETTHYSIVDGEGNAVSNTYTLNGGYGCAVTAVGTGVLLNNEMDDFAAKPGSPNRYGLIQNEQNAVAPGKRPLSSMTPAFVLHPDGSLYFVIGSPGGPTIINTVFQVISNVIDHKMDLQAAIDAPRLHHQCLPDELNYEPASLSADTIEKLVALGHKIAATPRLIGDAQGVMLEARTGIRLGASDARYTGVAVGY